MLRDELLAMADYHQRDGAHELAALCRSLATRLSEWCGEGSYAYLLDRPTTVPADSPLVVFDTRRCPQDVLRPGDVLDHGVRHQHRRAPLGTRTQRRARPERGARASPGARSC